MMINSPAKSTDQAKTDLDQPQTENRPDGSQASNKAALHSSPTKNKSLLYMQKIARDAISQDRHKRTTALTKISQFTPTEKLEYDSLLGNLRKFSK
jgi:hypothetical protein